MIWISSKVNVNYRIDNQWKQLIERKLLHIYTASLIAKLDSSQRTCIKPMQLNCSCKLKPKTNHVLKLKERLDKILVFKLHTCNTNCHYTYWDITVWFVKDPNKEWM